MVSISSSHSEVTSVVPLWSPSQAEIHHTAMSRFMLQVQQPNYASLWQWSVDQPAVFWRTLWEFCALRGDMGQVVLERGDQMPGARWFPQARLNYAENLLEPALAHPAEALVFWGEDKVKRHLSWSDLKTETLRFQQLLLDARVVAGDRVAGYLPNLPETLAAMLATTALGAIWSSASPDFGVQGVLDRFGQIEPKVLVCVDGYWYNGQALSCMEKNAQVLQQLPSVTQVVVVSYLNWGGPDPDLTLMEKTSRTQGKGSLAAQGVPLSAVPEAARSKSPCVPGANCLTPGITPWCSAVWPSITPCSFCSPLEPRGSPNVLSIVTVACCCNI